MNEIIVFDTETTGIPDWKLPSESEHQPHLVQLAATVFDLDAMKVTQAMNVIIKPEGWEITPETIEIHGITQEHALAVGVPEKVALEMFLALWNGRLRVSFNTTFDNRLIRIATKRYCSEEVVNAWHEGPYECAMIASRKIMGGKQPTLAEACKHFIGKELEGAHSALIDCNACLDVYLAIKNQKAAA